MIYHSTCKSRILDSSFAARLIQGLCFFVFATALSACTGVDSPIKTAEPPPPSAGGQATGRATVGILIPRAGTKYRFRAASVKSRGSALVRGKRPSYVSPSSQSIVVSANGQLLEAEDLNAQNPNCATLADGDLDCKIPLAPPLGEDSFTFSLWDSDASVSQLGQGNLLSTASLKFDVDGTAQTLDVGLEGVVRGVTLTPSEDYIPLFTSSNGVTYESVQIVVTAFDADGNQITDPSSDAVPYHSPITVTDRDKSGITSLFTATGPVVQIGSGTTSVSVPNGATNVYAQYFGGFIRAAAFDPSSADVTDATKLQPGGFSFDCYGQTGKFQSGAIDRERVFKAANVPTPSRRSPQLLRPNPSASTCNNEDKYSCILLDGNVIDLSSCYNYYGENCGMKPLPGGTANSYAMAPGECIYMTFGWNYPPAGDGVVWNTEGASGIDVEFSPTATNNGSDPATTCVLIYAPPNAIETTGQGKSYGGVLQLNGGGTPLLDTGYAVSTAEEIEPATYRDNDRDDCDGTFTNPYTGANVLHRHRLRSLPSVR